MPPPPPPPPYPHQQGNKHLYQAGTGFPNPLQALAAGWNFCKGDFGIVALVSSLAVVVSLVGNSAALVAADRDLLVAGGRSLVSGVVSLALVLILFRRALDWWDENHGRSHPRVFSEALSAAVRGAVPRLLIWFGWNLVLGIIVGIVLSVILTFAIFLLAFADSFVVALLFALALWIAALVAAVYLAFVPVAIADGLGIPFSASLRVVKGHFWNVIGTFSLLMLITFAAFVVLIVIDAAMGQSLAGDMITFAYVLASAAALAAVSLGAAVSMYRSVIQR